MAYGICDFKMAASVSFGALNFGDKTSSNSDSLQDASTALGELDKGRLLEFMSIVLLVFLDLLSASEHNINKSSPSFSVLPSKTLLVNYIYAMQLCRFRSWLKADQNISFR